LDGIFLMLSRMTKANKLRGALSMALFYAFCSVAPAAAFAFGDGAQAAHCLTDGDYHGLRENRAHEHSAAKAHAHADGTSHDHVQTADAGTADENGATSDGKCCGLFCVSALPAALAGGDLPDLPKAMSVAPVNRYGAGQPPVRLDRPPNTPLSL
jgi:hypothetical protein